MRSEAKALVLAGGGAKGSYQVGVYRALREVGWLPEIITGTSVGSLNGALFVMDHLDEAEQLWRTLDVHGVLEVPQGKKPEELRGFLLDVPVSYTHLSAPSPRHGRPPAPQRRHWAGNTRISED